MQALAKALIDYSRAYQAAKAARARALALGATISELTTITRRNLDSDRFRALMALHNANAARRREGRAGEPLTAELEACEALDIPQNEIDDVLANGIHGFEKYRK